MFEDQLRAWDGEEVVVRFDAPSASWMFVAIHSTVLGPAAGGTRMKSYTSPDLALQDALRLSTAMTSKNAMAGLPLGGGKGVLAVPEIPSGEARRELLLRYADLLESLHGTYRTACDMNTRSEDMDVIAERCSSVFGRTEAAGGSGTSAPATAVGVFHGLRAAVEHVFGSDELSGRSVAIQGVGAVGAPLARMLAEAGARLTLADLDDVRAKELAAELDADHVGPEAILETECDVLSPCATGGVLNAETIPALGCRVIAGAANNQLGEPGDADLLAGRGIVYAPDYVVNAGGIIYLAVFELLGEDEVRLQQRLQGIGEAMGEVLDLAAERRISTGAAADAIVERRLATAAALDATTTRRA